MALFEDLKIFTGNAHPALAADVCSYLGISLGKLDAYKFVNDNTFVQIKENVRERDVFLIQPIAAPVNDHLMELLIMIDAAKRASSGRITVVVPFYAYGRSDKKDQPRVPITARLIANLFEVSGADRVLTVDLHAGQIQGFFNIPLDELSAVGMLAKHFKERNVPNLVVAATDVGGGKHARNTARFLDAPIALVEKMRIGNEDRVEAINLIGDVQGKNVLIVDDEIGTGGTVVATAKTLVEHGARDIYCYATHAIYAGSATKVLEQSPIKEIVVTDTLPLSEEARGTKTKTVSVASLLGEAIHRIHSGLSVGAMFDQ
ncbi:MAG: ribose-phosphate pyrophosphokinase [Chloroflexi bacterium]|nr:ribose-phosphate pyrophosphokinase [Chloroflexota bacterium]